MMDEVSLTPRQQSWWGHLRACEASGLSVAATARREGLRIGSLYASRNRLSARQIKSWSRFSFGFHIPPALMHYLDRKHLHNRL